MAEVLDVEAEKAKIEAQKTAGRWINELGLSEKALAPYIERARKITRRYKKDDESVRATTSRNRQFSLLWANTETIRPALCARPPQPVVSRRLKDADPVAKAASEGLERCLLFSIDKNNLDGVTALRSMTLNGYGDVAPLVSVPVVLTRKCCAPSSERRSRKR